MADENVPNDLFLENSNITNLLSENINNNISGNTISENAISENTINNENVYLNIIDDEQLIINDQLDGNNQEIKEELDNNDDLPELVSFHDQEENQDNDEENEEDNEEDDEDGLPELISLNNDEQEENVPYFISNILLSPTGFLSTIMNFSQINPEYLDAINTRFEEIMNDADQNWPTIPPELCDFIDICYLENMQYDDENISEKIKYTIRSVFGKPSIYHIKILAAGILNYTLTSSNVIFNDNYALVYETLQNEIKRILRRSLTTHIFSNMIFNTGGAQEMEDVKLTVSREDLDNIPIITYKELSDIVKEKNCKCSICQDNFSGEDKIKNLICDHVYHHDCIDEWLFNHSHKCPCCKKVVANYKPNI